MQLKFKPIDSHPPALRGLQRSWFNVFCNIFIASGRLQVDLFPKPSIFHAEQAQLLWPILKWKVLQLLVVLLTLCWTWSYSVMSEVYWESENWVLFSSWSITSTGSPYCWWTGCADAWMCFRIFIYTVVLTCMFILCIRYTVFMCSTFSSKLILNFWNSK